MEELPVRSVEPGVDRERRPFGNPSAAGRARLARSRLVRRLRRAVARRDDGRSLLLLAGFLLVAYAPLVRILDHPETLSDTVCDHSTIAAGAGVVLILAVLGEHLLSEYSRLVRLTATARRPRRLCGR